MTTVINGVTVSGSPEEIKALIDLYSTARMPEKYNPLSAEEIDALVKSVDTSEVDHDDGRN